MLLLRPFLPLPRTFVRASSSLPPPSFPCVDAHAARESRLRSSASAPASVPTPPTGPEPPYARPSPSSYHRYHHDVPFPLVYSPTPLPTFDIAYESWGMLSPARDNVVLLHTGLSASSHAASTAANPAPGWWQHFIGPGKALDTDTLFVVCANVLGGCYGSTGPASLNPDTNTPYATTFPVLSVFDMARAQWSLLDHLGIPSLYASVGSSLGAMLSLATAWLHPDRVRNIVSISGSARTTPSAIAMRYAQRSVLMADPNWNNGFYYDGLPPHTGMKLARQIATITYRSGPEWDVRFGRRLRPRPDTDDPTTPRTPALCPDFLIETYLDHQGEQFCLKYDANSLIYISKAMDLFDMSYSALRTLDLGVSPDHDHHHEERQEWERQTVSGHPPFPQPTSTTGKPYPPLPQLHQSSQLSDLALGLRPLAHIPSLILGVQSDLLLPTEQQRELADALRLAGNDKIRYYELGGVWGHDTFLIDVSNVGGVIRGFLS